MLRVVSTYNPAHWTTYVERNIRSWMEHVDAELVVYHEGDCPNIDGIVWRQWEDIPGAVDFIEQAKTFPPACGHFGNGYDYHRDAAKFSRKVFAQLDAAEEDGEYLMWLDSDVEVLRDFGTPLIESLMLGMPLARYERPGFHSETGVVIWDQRSPDTEQFFRGYRALYENRRIYCLPDGWHDCWALDFVVSKLGMPTANLTRGSRDFKSAHLAALNVVPDSELGAYLRHDKGNLKHA